MGDAVYLGTAEPERETRSLICFDRQTGDVRWQTEFHKGKPVPHRNEKASDASSTPTFDGERFYINFLHDGGMVTSAVSPDGAILWQTRITDYTVHQGFGSSPAVYRDLVIVTADNKAGGAIAALDRQTGDIVWKQERPEKPNYASPYITNVCDRDQLLVTGCDLVSGFDPMTGEKLWEIPGATTECVTTTVTCGKLMFTSGGYPDNHVSAVKCDGSGEVAWRNGTRVYVPSMIVHEGHLFGTTDAGVAMCWNCQTGEERWKGRLGGTFSGSPVMVGDRIYVTNESGETFVFRASPEAFDLLAKNQLGDNCYSSPAICDGQIFLRGAEEKDGKRREFLACVEQKTP